MRLSALCVFLLAATVVVAQQPAAQQPTPRITRVEFTPARADEGGGVFISLIGTGTCTYTLDYGDGTSDRRTAQLPDRVQHKYPGDGEYLVVATPDAPCEGVARAKIDIRAIFVHEQLQALLLCRRQRGSTRCEPRSSSVQSRYDVVEYAECV
jgi:hypothetical protein